MKRGPKCGVCAHAARVEIDRCVAAGNTLERVASRFDVSRSALQRHSTSPTCRESRPTIERRPAPAPRAAAPAPAAAPELARRLTVAVLAQLDRVEESEDLEEVSKAKVHASCAATLTLLGKLTGHTRDVSEKTILASAAWGRIEAELLRVLSKWPDALREVGDALLRLGGDV